MIKEPLFVDMVQMLGHTLGMAQIVSVVKNALYEPQTWQKDPSISIGRPWIALYVLSKTSYLLEMKILTAVILLNIVVISGKGYLFQIMPSVG